MTQPLLFAALLAFPAAAAESAAKPEVAGGDDLMTMSLEQLTAIKVESVSGASKHEQEVTGAPSAVSIVTADDIKKQGYRTLADVLRSVRGFDVTYDRGIRGWPFTGARRPRC